MPAENGFQKVSHVLFDLDGTLVDTEKALATAATKIISELGHRFSIDTDMRMIGTYFEALAPYMLRKFNLSISEEELVERYGAEADQQLQNVRLMPGVERLLTHLHNERIPMAIATNSSKQSYTLKCRSHCNLFSVMHHIVCINDAELKHGKPEPDIYLLAASRFARPVEPRCCLVIEDAPIGIKAGVAAGMQVLMITYTGVPPKSTNGATQVLSSMECFLPEQFGLPPYDCEEQFTFG